MKCSWQSRFTNWYSYWGRRRTLDEVDPFTDIELDATCRDPKRVDSAISVENSTPISSSYSTPSFSSQLRQTDSIHLELNFGDGTCIKSLDYGTFSRWSAVERLMVDMEEDGMFCEELWDVSECMRVCKGDWDARVRPGWDIHALCQIMPAVLEARYLEGDSDSGSDDPESEGDQWLDDVLDHYQEEEWCLPRWMDKVEPERSMSIDQEPSWTMLALGCVSMALFIVATIMYTS